MSAKFGDATSACKTAGFTRVRSGNCGLLTFSEKSGISA